MTALTAANVIELLDHTIHHISEIDNIRVFKIHTTERKKWNYQKKMQGAIWLQKYYYRYEFEYNHIVYEQPLKIIEYKESIIYRK